MNWEAIGAIGAIIGALAVVITLVYLSIQTRHNSKISLSSMELELRNNASSINDLLMCDPKVSELAKKLSDPSCVITDDDIIEVDAFAIRQYHNWSSANVAYRNGMLSEQSWRLLYLNEVPRIVRKYPGLIPRFEAILASAGGELDEEATYLQKCITTYKAEQGDGVRQEN